MRARLRRLRRFFAGQAYLTTFESVVVTGVLACLSLAALTATSLRYPQTPLRAVVTIFSNAP